MTVPIAAVCVIVAAFILWGVGDFVRAVTGSRREPWPVSIGIGLAAVVFVGGLLNFSHMAYRPALWMVVIAGIAISVARIRSFRLGGVDRRGWFEILASGLVIGAVLLFTISTQLPPRMFNFHDDFEKYLAHPVKMLATGTVASGPLSSMGAETLGAQAFLQGFAVSVLPIGYINAADAVFGLLLMMLLAAAAGWRRFHWFPGAVLGPLLVVIVNPQYVNVSALYIGAALMATAVMLVGEEAEPGTHSPVILGSIYAALIALKPIFAVFAAGHLLFSALAAGGAFRAVKRSLDWSVRAILWTAVGLAPWVAIHVPSYFSRGMFAGQPSPDGPRGDLNLFSMNRLLYGSSYADYSIVALLACFTAILAAISWRRRGENGHDATVAPGIFAGAVSGVLSYIIVLVGLGPRLSGYETSLRFSVPFIMGACLIPILMAPALPKLPRAASESLALVAGIFVLGAFLPSAVGRYREAVQFHSVIAFNPVQQYSAYLSYSDYWLSPAASEYVRGFQNKVPRGARLLVWINTPFLLDYKRNAIVDVDTAGIGSPWAHVPEGVSYVLWQYKGLGVRTSADYVDVMAGEGARERTIAARALAFGEWLMRVSRNTQVVASDDRFVLFRIHPNF